MRRRDFLKRLATAVGVSALPASLVAIANEATTEPAQEEMIEKAKLGHYRKFVIRMKSTVKVESKEEHQALVSPDVWKVTLPDGSEDSIKFSWTG